MSARKPRRDSYAYRQWKRERSSAGGKRCWEARRERDGADKVREAAQAQMYRANLALQAKRATTITTPAVRLPRCEFSLPGTLLARLNKAADKAAITRTELLRVICSQWLDGFEANERRPAAKPVSGTRGTAAAALSKRAEGAGGGSVVVPSGGGFPVFDDSQPLSVSTTETSSVSSADCLSSAEETEEVKLD